MTAVSEPAPAPAAPTTATTAARAPVRAARRLDGHRLQGVRRPPAVGPVRRAGHRARPGRGHPAVLRRGLDPRRRLDRDRRPGHLHRPVLARPRRRRRRVHACPRSPGSWPTSRRCSAWPSRSMRSTASGPRARCRGCCPSRSIATTSSTASSSAGLAVIGIVLVVGRRRDRRLRAHPAGHRARRRPRSCASSCGCCSTFIYVVALAGLRDAPVGGRAARGDVGPHRLRDVAAADLLRRAHRVAHRRRSGAGHRAPPRSSSRASALQETLRRFLPDTLYREASLTLLNPQVSSVSTPATIGGIEQAQQRIPSLLSLDQSFILVWPQVVALVALTVACFALAYVLFMRQEVRA